MRKVFRLLACLRDQTKVAFLESRLLTSQSEQFKEYSKSSDWLEKSRPSKKHFCFHHVSRIYVSFVYERKIE